ncbi:MAG: glycosyltransferase family 4 protein [Simkania negevensis]|nr:glycosyltransferase family 4 protein [Simkania negevensis]
MEREKKRWGFISPRFNPLHQKILEIEKIAFEDPKLRLLFTNSHMVKGEIIRYYNTPPEKIQVIHNGVEWKEMETDFSTWLEKKQIICAKLGLDPSCYHFLFVGNGYKRKGLFLLLNALAHLPFKEFHLTVVGKDNNMQEFINIAEKLGLKNQVSFFGERSNIRPFYQYCDCLIIPSLYDPFANVTIEALAMGLFVVSSKSNGGYEVLTKENGAIIEDLFALDSLKETLLSAIEHPKTWIRSQNIRNSIKYLDYPHPLKTLIDATLGSTSL